MPPISPQDQDVLNVNYKNLSGKEKAEFLLSFVIGTKLKERELEMIKAGLSEYIVWHKKQHPASKTCDHCEFVNDNIIMFKVINYWSDHFQSLKKKK